MLPHSPSGRFVQSSEGETENKKKSRCFHRDNHFVRSQSFWFFYIGLENLQVSLLSEGLVFQDSFVIRIWIRWLLDNWIIVWFFLWIPDQSKTFRLSDGSFNRFGFRMVSGQMDFLVFSLDNRSIKNVKVVSGSFNRLGLRLVFRTNGRWYSSG